MGLTSLDLVDADDHLLVDAADSLSEDYEDAVEMGDPERAHELWQMTERVLAEMQHRWMVH